PGVFRDARARFLAAALVLEVAATLLTPFGPDLYGYVVRLARHPVIRTIVTEWRPTTPGTSTGMVFFLSLPAAAACLALSRRRPTARDVLLLGPFALLGLQAIRNVAWWGFVLMPVLAPYLAELRFLPRPSGTDGPPPSTVRTGPRGAIILNALVLGFMLAIALSSLPWTKDANPLTADEKRAVVSPDD